MVFREQLKLYQVLTGMAQEVMYYSWFPSRLLVLLVMSSPLQPQRQPCGSPAAYLSITNIIYINLFPLKQNSMFSHAVTKVICWEKNFVLFTASKWVLNCSPSFCFSEEQAGRHSDINSSWNSRFTDFAVLRGKKSCDCGEHAELVCALHNV